jgi:hypothetical protein
MAKLVGAATSKALENLLLLKDKNKETREHPEISGSRHKAQPTSKTRLTNENKKGPTSRPQTGNPAANLKNPTKDKLVYAEAASKGQNSTRSSIKNNTTDNTTSGNKDSNKNNTKKSDDRIFL